MANMVIIDQDQSNLSDSPCQLFNLQGEMVKDNFEFHHVYSKARSTILNFVPEALKRYSDLPDFIFQLFSKISKQKNGFPIEFNFYKVKYTFIILNLLF